jgi:dUTP pyrophosphatase
MQVKIKRIDKTLPLPAYQTEGSAGFDLYAREDTTILPHEIKLIPGNFIVDTPEGYMLAIVNRSSTPKRKGLMLPNGIGVIDSDYCGPNDELGILMYNFKDEEVLVERGERVAQAIFIKVEQAEWEEIEEVKNKNRGGFGSTGK